MHRCPFYLRSLKDSSTFEVKAPTADAVEGFFHQFLGLFPGVLNYETHKINALTRKSPELEANMVRFVDLYGAKVPGVKSILAFIRNLNDGEHFYVMPIEKLEQTEFITFMNYLDAIENGADFEAANRQLFDFFGDFLNHYQIGAYGDQRLNVGQSDKSLRTCRFCGRKQPDTTFNKKAHAISEALGNKTVVLYDECDECNERFSETIEPDFVNFLAFHRTLYGIKGKGGEKKLVGKNFKFFREGNPEIHFEGTEDRDGDDQPPFHIPLDFHVGLSKQNIYRTLCKYFLSVVGDDKLPHFQSTIDWINGNKTADKLPELFVYEDHKMALQPIMMTFFRKIDDRKLPYAVGEFRFALTRYVFIVPFSDADELTYLSKEEYGIFLTEFQHYNIIEKFKRWDLSDNASRPFRINIDINIREKDDELEEGNAPDEDTPQ